MSDSDMSATKLRRAFQLAPAHRTVLAKIKQLTGAKTDTAAINFALSMTDRLPTWQIAKIEQALWLQEEITRRVNDGGTLIIETTVKKGEKPNRAELMLPPTIVGDDSADQPFRPEIEIKVKKLRDLAA